MFYSQFILAKKGPLGTIWIAAHLERKLRKNQVADTDIGDSVDSILSPDVPIALRLSSHLLLGVVRIYSRKVNYLFHDCSEALLKIKQAFRSTVVDLPPEESTAPYHSITLPETFDLDDFELPDSALQGNYTDHHVGTREQITLQDSVDGTSYTALQFGLDERFGDGDSSQIRLLLDEDLFMHNISSPQLASAQLGTEEGAIHVGQSSNAPTNMDIDGGENGSDAHMNLDVVNLSEVLSNDCDKHDLSSAEKLRMSGDSSRHGYNIQTPDLNHVISPEDHAGGPSAFPDYRTFTPADIVSADLFDHAQAPATPGLLEEAVRANVQETPALSPQEKNLSPIVMDVINADNSVSPRSEVVAPAPINTVGLENGVTMEPEPEDAAHFIASLGSNLSEAKPVSLAPECSDGNLGLPDEAHLDCGQNNGDHLQSEIIHRTKPVGPVSECLGGFLAVTDAIHLEREQKKSDQTRSGFVCNEVSNMPTLPECGQNNGDHLQSEIIHRTKPVSPVSESECLDGFLAVTDAIHLECEQKKSDQTHSGFVCNEVSNMPTMPECGQNNGDHLQSEIIHRTKPVSPVSECLGGFLAVTDTIHLEREQKKSDQAHSGFVCNEVSNMPTMPNGVETLRPEVAHLGDPVTSSHSIQAAKVDMSLNKSTTDEIVVASHDNVRVLGVSSEINTTSLWNKADPSFLTNQEHAGDVNCYLTSTKPALGSDLYLRSCSSQKNLDNISPSKAETINEADLLILDNQSHVKNGDSCFISSAPALSSDLHLLPCNLSLNQVNLLSAHAGALVEDTPVFSRSVLTCTSETPSIEQPLHVCGSSLNLQGEDNHTVNNTNTIQEIYPKSDSVLSNILLHAFEPDGQLTSVFSKGTQPVNLNFPSSGYSEPEKVLFATNCDVNLPNDLGQITAEKGVSESTESINQNNSLTGKKHHLTDSPLLQHSDSVKKSRIPRLKRNATYMPDDDDLLTSILGGRTPTLRMGPTPVPQKAVQRKRPRLTPRVGVPKRKVLLDDTMVLHADAIRKQLVSIEDIRRMRKKAPCTRPEIWMIQKSAMEEEVFSESLFTGISTELNKLNTKTYGMNENKSSQIVDQHLDEFDLYVQQSKEKERSRMEFDSRNNRKETGDPADMSDQLDCGMQRCSDTSVSILAHNGMEAGVLNAHKKIEPRMSQLEPSISIPAHHGIEAGVLDAHKKIEPHMSQLKPSVSIPAHNGMEGGVIDAHKKIGPRMSQLEPSVSIPAHNGMEDGVLDAHKKIEPRMSQLEPSVSIPAHNGMEAGVLDAHKKIEPHMSQLEPSVSIPAQNGMEAGVIDAHKKIEPRMSQLEPSVSIPAHNGIEAGLLDAHKKIEPRMSQLEPSVSIRAHNGTEAGVLDAHKKIEPRMSQLEPSVSIPAQNGTEAGVIDAHKTIEPRMSQLEPSLSVPAHNGMEAGVLDAHNKIEPRLSQLEPSVSIPAHNGMEAGVLDAHNKIEPHMSQREPSINDQTITVSTTDVQGRVGVEMPLICASHSVSEIEVSSISNIGEFVHKNTEVTTILQKQELRLDLVQSSDRPIEITDRTSSFAGTAVGDAASAEDEIRCRIVDGGIQEPPVASASAVGDAASAKDEIRCRIFDGGMQELPVASASIVADMPLVCSPLSGHEIGISTVSTSEKEAINIPEKSKLVDDLARPSDKSMEMVDRTPNFGGATVGGVVSSENADRDNSVRVLVGECSIPEDASISQNTSRMDVLDSNGPQYIHDVGEIENGEILVSMLDRCLLEDRAGMAADSSNVVEHANIIPDAAAEHTVEKMLVDVERPTSEVSCSENTPSVSSCLHQQNTETENVPSAVGDNSGLLECIIEGSLDVESARMDRGAARKSTDLYDTFNNNDTEFLNADYEPDIDEAEDNGMPDTEDSGWSTRTRGVAKYLKTLFNEEHGRGRKTIAVDHLLAGKTRKEASRMFFETLVLRTRDYIHVEQEIPFERINIKPGPKLLKSKF